MLQLDEFIIGAEKEKVTEKKISFHEEKVLKWDDSLIYTYPIWSQNTQEFNAIRELCVILCIHALWTSVQDIELWLAQFRPIENG